MQIDYIFKYTEYKGHGKIIAKDYINRKIRKIIVAGGDGTVNEILLTIADEDIILGILPMGTGNDLAKSLHLPSDWKKVFNIILKERIKRIDLGYVNNIPFINIAGLGLDVEVVKRCKKIKKITSGMPAYLAALVISIINWENNDIIIECKEMKSKFFSNIIAIGNGSHYAGGINVTPCAKMNDGMLDICIVHDLGKFGFLRLLPQIIKGKHLNSPYVAYFKTQEIYIDSSVKMKIQLDGEILSETPCKIKLNTKKIKICL